MSELIPARMQNFYRTAAVWEALNPVLLEGEFGVVSDIDPPPFKVGDGTTPWLSLPYSGVYDLDDLADVDLTTPPTDGQTLVWSVADDAFIPGDVGSSTLADLTDVDVATDPPVTGSTLVYDEVDSKWKPGAALNVLALEHTTVSLADDAIEDFAVAAGNLYHLRSITSTEPAWIRVYDSDASRESDERTVSGAPYPAAGYGFHAEVVTVTENETITFAPVPTCQGTGGEAYIRVQNLSGGTATITLTFNVLSLI